MNIKVELSSSTLDKGGEFDEMWLGYFLVLFLIWQNPYHNPSHLLIYIGTLETLKPTLIVNEPARLALNQLVKKISLTSYFKQVQLTI